MKDAGYDPLKDLQPIALAGVVPLALVVPIKSPYSTMAEWVAALRGETADAPLHPPASARRVISPANC